MAFEKCLSFASDMKSNIILLQWVNEILWLIASVVITAFLTWNIYQDIDRFFFWYIAATMILGLNYLRWILFPRHSPIMLSFWFKMVMLLVNIPLLMVIGKYFLSIMEIFDSFNFSYGLSSSYLIKADATLDFIQQVRTLTIASVASLLVLIIMFEIRAVQLIFKWRQVPVSLLK